MAPRARCVVNAVNLRHCSGMHVFVCTDHDLHWPVGCASVVIAGGEDEARVLLDAALIDCGLKPSEQKPYTLRQLGTDEPIAVVLLDGEY